MYRARISKWSLWPFILFGALLIPLFGAGLLLWLWAWIVYTTTELAITNKRVIAKTGLIQRRTIEMFLEKIESIRSTRACSAACSIRFRRDLRHWRAQRAVQEHLRPAGAAKDFMMAADSRRAA